MKTKNNFCNAFLLKFKEINLLTFILALSSSIYAQVGINTQSPQAMFHLKNTETNVQNSALKVEGEIKKNISDVTSSDREIYLDNQGNLFSTPPKQLALNLVVSLSPSTDAGTTCLSGDLGANIRRVIYNRIVYSSVSPSATIFNTTTGVFTAPKTGYYQIDLNLGLVNNRTTSNNNGVNAEPGQVMLRLGASVGNQENFTSGNASFSFLNQKLNASGTFNGVRHPEILTAKGVIYLTEGQKMSAGTRFITPENSSNGFTCNVETLNYRRENVSTMIITYLSE
ncbi:hypothetical protein [Empedobacter brevis]